MLSQSGLLDQLMTLMPPGSPRIFSLYGDPAYPQSRYLFGGFHDAPVASREAAWNTCMSKVRQPVEWNFGEIAKQFCFLDFRASMKIFGSPIARYYIIAAFLVNIRSTFYGNQTAAYFDAEPMSLDEYLNLV